MSPRDAPGPRERLLDAAQSLTYSHGMNVGVDTLLTAANAARRSLYEHFGGKDGLLTEVLQRTTEADESRYAATMDAAGTDPRDRLLAVFDSLAAVIAEPGFRGCRYLAADLAFTDPDHPGHAITRAYRERVSGRFAHELRRLDHPRPDAAADRLLLLIDGALAAGATRPRTDPAAAARELAELVIDTRTRP